ncbi:unnamed protein product [Amoebophrya sp. A120]|nr:unnamed protein product [Amoebophrya sp. A120]|eukprot:GSA120T00023764001.1
MLHARATRTLLASALAVASTSSIQVQLVTGEGAATRKKDHKNEHQTHKQNHLLQDRAGAPGGKKLQQELQHQAGTSTSSATYVERFDGLGRPVVSELPKKNFAAPTFLASFSQKQEDASVGAHQATTTSTADDDNYSDGKINSTSEEQNHDPRPRTCTVDAGNCPMLQLWIGLDIGSSGTRAKVLQRCRRSTSEDHPIGVVEVGQERDNYTRTTVLQLLPSFIKPNTLEFVPGAGCATEVDDILVACGRAPTQLSSSTDDGDDEQETSEQKTTNPCKLAAKSLVFDLASRIRVANDTNFSEESVKTGAFPVKVFGYATAGARLRADEPNEILKRFEQAVFSLNTYGNRGPTLQRSHHMRVLHGWEEAKLEAIAIQEHNMFSMGGASAQIAFAIPQIMNDTVYNDEEGGASSTVKQTLQDFPPFQNLLRVCDNWHQVWAAESSSLKNDKPATGSARACHSVRHAESIDDAVRTLIELHPLSSSNIRCGATETSATAFLRGPVAEEADRQVNFFSPTQSQHHSNDVAYFKQEEVTLSVVYASFLANADKDSVCHVHTGRNGKNAAGPPGKNSGSSSSTSSSTSSEPIADSGEDNSHLQKEALPPCEARHLDEGTSYPQHARGRGYYHLAGGMEGFRAVFLRWGQKCLDEVEVPEFFVKKNESHVVDSPKDYNELPLTQALCACGWGNAYTEKCAGYHPYMHDGANENDGAGVEVLPAEQSLERAQMCMESMMVLLSWDDEVLFLNELLQALYPNKNSLVFHAAGAVGSSLRWGEDMKRIAERAGFDLTKANSLHTSASTDALSRQVNLVGWQTEEKLLADPEFLRLDEGGPLFPSQKLTGQQEQLLWRALAMALGMQVGAPRGSCGRNVSEDGGSSAHKRPKTEHHYQLPAGVRALFCNFGLLGRIGHHPITWLPAVTDDFPADESEGELGHV